MKRIEIEGKFEISDKRFYLPIKIEKECPNCKNKCVADLNSNYLSYPNVNEKEQQYFYCDKCEQEFEIDIILRIGLDIGDDIRKI